MTAASSPRASVARRPGGSPFLQQAAGMRILAFVIETQSDISPLPIQSKRKRLQALSTRFAALCAQYWWCRWRANE